MIAAMQPNLFSMRSLLPPRHTQGRAKAPMAVLDEVEKKSKELHAWLKERPNLFIDYEVEVQIEVKAILAKYPKLVAVKSSGSLLIVSSL